MQGEMLIMYSDNLQFQANKFNFSMVKYQFIFLELLKQIYESYTMMIKDKVKLPKYENGIRDILVDDYLSKNISQYEFKNEM